MAISFSPEQQTKIENAFKEFSKSKNTQEFENQVQKDIIDTLYDDLKLKNEMRKGDLKKLATWYHNRTRGEDEIEQLNELQVLYGNMIPSSRKE